MEQFTHYNRKKKHIYIKYTLSERETSASDLNLRMIIQTDAQS